MSTLVSLLHVAMIVLVTLLVLLVAVIWFYQAVRALWGLDRKSVV